MRLTIVFGTWGLVMDMGNVMGGDAVTSHSTGDDNSHVVQPRPTERERNGSRQVYSMPKISLRQTERVSWAADILGLFLQRQWQKEIRN